MKTKMQLNKISKSPINILENTKQYLRVLDNDQDTLISTHIQAHIDDFEEYTNIDLSTTTYEMYLSNLTSITVLPKGKIQNIVKIQTMKHDYTYEDIDNSQYFLYESLGLHYLQSNIIFTPILNNHPKYIKITFQAGHTTTPALILNYLYACVGSDFDGTVLSSHIKNIKKSSKVHINLKNLQKSI